MGHDYTEKSFWYELILNFTKQCCVSLFTNEVSPGKLGCCLEQETQAQKSSNLTSVLHLIPVLSEISPQN